MNGQAASAHCHLVSWFPIRSVTCQSDQNLFIVQGHEEDQEPRFIMPSARENPLLIMTPPRYGSVMSASNIDELAGNVEGGNFAKYNRSSSVGPGVTPSNLNPLQRNRRALYVNLPFFR